jgi:hypothetical protein
MNTTNKILLYSGLGLAGATILRYVYKNGVLATKWDYSIDEFKLISVVPKIRTNMYFTIINKSAFKATIKDIDITVLTEEKPVSKIIQAGPYEIAADGKTKIYVSIDVKPEDISSNWRMIVAQIIKNNDIALDYVGTMKVKTPLGWVKIPIMFSNTGREMYDYYKKYYK